MAEYFLPEALLLVPAWMVAECSTGPEAPDRSMASLTVSIKEEMEVPLVMAWLKALVKALVNCRTRPDTCPLAEEKTGMLAEVKESLRPE